MFRFIQLTLFIFLTTACFAQYNWKVEKQKNGINIFTADVKGSNFKAIKVECTLSGTYTKLISILTNVAEFKNWIYNNKVSRIIRKNSSLDLIYYSETHMPWPLSNRDAVIHLKFNTDSLPKFLLINGSNESQLLPFVPGIVRVQHYKANWKVTMPTTQTIQIIYILEIDPGGTIPAWIANSFADKGPYGTFSKMAEQLKK